MRIYNTPAPGCYFKSRFLTLLRVQLFEIQRAFSIVHQLTLPRFSSKELHLTLFSCNFPVTLFSIHQCVWSRYFSSERIFQKITDRFLASGFASPPRPFFAPQHNRLRLPSSSVCDQAPPSPPHPRHQPELFPVPPMPVCVCSPHELKGPV